MIVVTGAGGMLGKAIVEECVRASIPVTALDHNSWDVTDPAAFRWASAGDVVINCAGILPGGNDVDMVRVNALAPHYLASLAEQRGFHLVHISTDCVFSGGGSTPVLHTIGETPNPDTMYSRTKRAGEPVGKPNVTVVRTSFVGPNHGLWEWVRSQPENACIPGWVNAWWSGSTVWEVAKALVHLAKLAILWDGNLRPIEHLATAVAVSKYSVLLSLVDVLRVDTLVSFSSEVKVDRSLEPTLLLLSLDDALQDWVSRP